MKTPRLSFGKNEDPALVSRKGKALIVRRRMGEKSGRQVNRQPVWRRHTEMRTLLQLILLFFNCTPPFPLLRSFPFHKQSGSDPPDSEPWSNSLPLSFLYTSALYILLIASPLPSLLTDTFFQKLLQNFTKSCICSFNTDRKPLMAGASDLVARVRGVWGTVPQTGGHVLVGFVAL